MKLRLFALMFAAISLLAGCDDASNGTIPVSARELTPIPELSAYQLGEPIQVDNLTIVPVICPGSPDSKQEYATLAEAKKHGWVEIIEKPGSQEVSWLLVRNTGPKPLLLLGGELLLGGKQD